MFSEVLVCSCLLSFGDKLGLCRQGEGRGDKNLGEGTTLFLASGVLASVFYSFIQVLFGGDLVANRVRGEETRTWGREQLCFSPAVFWPLCSTLLYRSCLVVI